MKKTILSIAVGMASFGAFAADSIADAPVAPAKDVVAQSIENAEIFGKVGVSFDHAKDTEIDYTRNTEVGVRSNAKIGHGLTATAEVVANFDNMDKQLGLDKVEMGVEHEMGAVHFGKIDDRYDMATTKFDQFSDVFGGVKVGGHDVELYNATGKVDGVALSATPVAGLDLTAQVSGSDLGDDLAVTAAYSIAGLDLAAGYQTEAKESSGILVKATQDQEAYKLGAGYGIAGFYTGLIYEAQSTFNETDVNTIALSTSYKIDAFTLKAGYANEKSEAKTGDEVDTKTMRLAAQYDLRDNVALNAGYAKVDNGTSEDLITAGMIVRF